MLRRLRHLRISLRFVLAAVVWLGILAQPVLVVACEIHETQHLAATGHAHDGPEHNDGAESAHPSPDESGKLAELVHLGHCCAHATVFVISIEPPTSDGVESIPVGLPVTAPLNSRPARLLRPPIG